MQIQKDAKTPFGETQTKLFCHFEGLALLLPGNGGGYMLVA